MKRRRIVIEILPRALWVIMAICLYPGAYLDYRKRTGMFLPRVWIKEA